MSRATDLHQIITSIQDRHKVAELEESKSPYVGLFYVIGKKLYWDGVPISDGETSHYFKIFPKMHPTFWENTVIKGNPELKTFDAYYFPRGRVVYDTNSGKYEIVADRCIIGNDEMISQIISEMRLPQNNAHISGDIHYECSRCKEEHSSK